MTHKAEIYTEAKAAVAGGVTSYMEMPNTIPQAVTNELLEKKYEIGKKRSLANYSFYLGATNDNIEELHKVDRANILWAQVPVICWLMTIKLFVIFFQSMTY